MAYMKTEWYKIKKSWQSKVGYLLVFSLIVAVIIGYKLNANFEISGLDIVLVSLGNIVNSMILHFSVVLVASLLFAGEFTDKTYKYIMIRPVSTFKLFLSKIIAVWYYSAKVIILIAILSFLSGLVFWGMGAVHGDEFTVIDYGLLRIFLYYIGTWVNLLFIISLTTFFAVIVKNQLSTVITTMGLFLLLIISTNIIPGILSYTPIPYFNLRIFLSGNEIQVTPYITGILITLLYSTIVTLGSYFHINDKDILI